MTRVARVVIPGTPHHVSQRGNRRQQTFFSDRDYALYVKIMSEPCEEHGVEVWAYCLMPNHVHLVAVPRAEDSLSKAIGNAHRQYTRVINTREGWSGYLWQGRFASCAMDELHTMRAVRYVEFNPVRGGLTQSPFDWRYSSARPHLCGRDDALVRVGPMRNRVVNWREYLTERLDPDSLESLRVHVRTGRPLGSKEFVQELESITGRRLRPKPPGPPPMGATTARVASESSVRVPGIRT